MKQTKYYRKNLSNFYVTTLRAVCHIIIIISSPTSGKYIYIRKRLLARARARARYRIGDAPLVIVWLIANKNRSDRSLSSSCASSCAVLIFVRLRSLIIALSRPIVAFALFWCRRLFFYIISFGDSRLSLSLLRRHLRLRPGHKRKTRDLHSVLLLLRDENTRAILLASLSFR